MTKPVSTLKTFEHGGKTVAYHSLKAVEDVRGAPLSELPYIVRILLESALRNQANPSYEWKHVEALAQWKPGTDAQDEIPYLPARVLLQDFDGRALRGGFGESPLGSGPRRRRPGDYRTAGAGGPRGRPFGTHRCGGQ